jgi:hypothetical protein
LAPQTLPHWAQIYYVFSFKGRVAGESFDPEMWYHPWWLYPSTFFRATFFAVPLALVGAFKVCRSAPARISAVLLALLSPCVVFSLFRVKQPSYIYPAFPALAFLLAYGFRCFFGNVARRDLVLAAILSALSATLFFHEGLFGTRALAAILLLYTMFASSAFVPGHHGMGAKRITALASLSAMLLAGVVVVRQSLLHRTYYREVASYLAPRLQPYRPQEAAFTAPEFTTLEFYSFRTGHYWGTYYFHQPLSDVVEGLRRGSQAFYIVDPSGKMYGGKISAEKLAAVHEYALDITPQIERSIGHSLPFRVYVPKGQMQGG